MSFRAATSGSINATNDVTVITPAGLADGDVIIIAFETSTVHTIDNILSGWTQGGTTQDQGTDQSVSIFYKVASSEGASWTWTDVFVGTPTGVWGCVAYSGVDAGTPLDVAIVQTEDSFGTVQSSGEITPINDNSRIVSIFGVDPNAARTGTPDDNPPCTERVEANGDNDGFMYIQDHLQTTASAETHEFTISTADQSASFIVALREAAAGGGSPVASILQQHAA